MLSTHVVSELQLVGQQLPSIAAGLVDHSRQHLAPEVEGAVVAEVLVHPDKETSAANRQQTKNKSTNKTNKIHHGSLRFSERYYSAANGNGTANMNSKSMLVPK